MATKTASGRRRWASLAEAAEYAGVHVNTLRRHIASGYLTGYRFGPRAMRVDLDELDRVMRPVPTFGGDAA